MTRRPRVLVVDDSAFARTVLGRLLRESGAVDVVGTAPNGREGLERIDLLDPDIVTLDLTMPVLDGLEVLRQLHGRARPRVIVVSISSVETDLGAEALVLGAVEVIAKPTALASDRLIEIGAQLLAAIAAVAPAAVAPGAIVDATPPHVAPVARAGDACELIVIGASTGGPQALNRLVSALPESLAAPVAIVLHIPVGYTEALAARLDQGSRLHVIEAVDGMPLERGLVVLARGGINMQLERSGPGVRVRLRSQPVSAYVPSVNELFISGAACAGPRTLGVVLTGMGDDGLVGARAIAAAGGALITEAPATCVVYGMPRAVFEAGLGAASVPLDRIAEEIAKRA